MLRTLLPTIAAVAVATTALAEPLYDYEIGAPLAQRAAWAGFHRDTWGDAVIAPRVDPPALDATSAPDDRRRTGDRWIELVAPATHDDVHEAPWIEVRGIAHARALDVRYDIVIAFDLSTSSFLPAGFDVDGDGTTASLADAASASLHLKDPDDSVAHAGLEVVRSFLDRVDPERARVALLTFADRTQIRAALGAPHVTADVVERLHVFPRRGGTDLAAAVRRAVHMLGATPLTGNSGRRERILLLVGDGFPTAPGSYHAAARYAERAAVEAARANVRVFGVSPERADRPISPVLVEMARASGGEAFQSDLAEEWLRHLEPTRPLEIRAVRLKNLRTGRAGRAIRWFQDGSFDGYVGLAAGANRVRAQVELANGDTLERDFLVTYRPAPEAEEALLRDLRNRTLETELVGQARAGSPSRRLSVDVRRAP